MKATGIVRRIDELGRVVIPKEIRRTMRIRENEPLEIYTERDGEIIFKKYSPIGGISASSAQCAEAIAKSSGCPVAVCDKDNIIAVSGISKKEFLEKPISLSLSTLLSRRKLYSFDSNSAAVEMTDNGGRISCFAPILADGDVIGAVMSLAQDDKLPTETEQKLVSAGAMFLGKQTEV